MVRMCMQKQGTDSLKLTYNLKKKKKKGKKQQIHSFF